MENIAHALISNALSGRISENYQASIIAYLCFSKLLSGYERIIRLNNKSVTNLHKKQYQLLTEVLNKQKRQIDKRQMISK